VLTKKLDINMRKLIALAVLTLTSQAVAIFAGEPVVSSKQVIAPPPPPPPEFFRPNEFDIGAFGTYATGVGSNGGKLHAWGGGMDFTYWFPWKYAGVRFQGTGASIRGGGGSRTVTFVDGFTLREPRTVGGGSVAAGIITADGLLRLPLDEFWPGVHLAPYIFAGFGGILLGNNDNGTSLSPQTFTITNDTTGETRTVTVTGRRISRLRQNIGTDRVLGHVGGGLEYRFTPHIGIFGEIGYDFPNLASNNFIAVNFGLRYAF
jgi:hypothetical protein